MSSSMEMLTKEKLTPAPAVKSKGKTGDMIVDTVHEVENLKYGQAFKASKILSEGQNFNVFKMGGLLNRLIELPDWQEEGYTNFKAFAENAFGISHRRSSYYMSIYTGLVNANVKWAEVESIGWTKLREIAPIITEENAHHWIKVAETMTAVQLAQAVKDSKKSGKDTPPEKNDMTTMSFKLFPDQKEEVVAAIEKMMVEIEDDSPGVALTNLAGSYLSGGLGKPKPMSLVDAMMGRDITEVVDAMNVVFSDMNLKILQEENEGLNE